MKPDAIYQYSTEAQLNVLCENYLVMSLEGIEELKNEKSMDMFNIYAILAKPKYIFDKSSLKTTDKGINFTILNEQGIEYGNIKGFNFIPVFQKINLNDFNFNWLNLKCNSSCTQMDITMNSSESLINYLKEKTTSDLSEKELEDYICSFQHFYDIEEILSCIYREQEIENRMEVLYIGQSQGRKRNRGALERLQSHETLQKILIDCHTKYPDKRLFIMLFKFSEMQVIAFNGINEINATKEEDKQHHDKLVADGIDITLNPERDKIRQVINITEAAMINHFQPSYNKTFMDNFPSKTHSSYKHYYDLEYSAISVELGDNEFVLYTESQEWNSPWDFITYDLFSGDYSSIFDIMKKKPND